MKDLIGKRVEFVVDGIPKPFAAKVVEDLPSMIYVLGHEEVIPRRIVKSKIVMMTPLEDVGDVKRAGLQVLYCNNSTIKCPGVKYIMEGDGVKRSDFNRFMEPCPKRSTGCRCGTKGDLKSLDAEVLSEMLSGTMVGDYPEGDN